ncbi:putative ribosomal N-acetyltransferase YdaF [compost metagenome]
MTPPLPQLQTPRLLLRPLVEQDAEAVFAYCANPNVSRYTLWEPHRSLDDALSYIRAYAFPKYELGIPEPFGIVSKEEGERVIGTVGAFWVSEAHRCMEIAYALAEPYWGQGLVAEAARAVRDFVFETYPIERLQCRCKAENAPSARVMEKLGMTREGTLRAALYHRERFWDMHYYSLLRSEWEHGNRKG